MSLAWDLSPYVLSSQCWRLIRGHQPVSLNRYALLSGRLWFHGDAHRTPWLMVGMKSGVKVAPQGLRAWTQKSGHTWGPACASRVVRRIRQVHSVITRSGDAAPAPTMDGDGGGLGMFRMIDQDGFAISLPRAINLKMILSLFDFHRKKRLFLKWIVTAKFRDNRLAMTRLHFLEQTTETFPSWVWRGSLSCI